MDLVYNKAQATIIAAAGNKPTFGLPGVQNLPRAPQMCATISKSEYVFVPPDPAHEIQNSKWNSRGWTHQETVLSRRRLIFCEDQVYFECSSMHCYEAMKLPLEALHVWTRQRFSKWNEPGLFTPLSKQRYPLDETFRQISQYTKRDLSCPEDILNGMMGIFGAYANIYQSFLHYGGIPIVPDVTLEDFDSGNIRHSTRVEQFATGLCWKLKGPSKRRLGFPSWSWTGWYGVVDTLNGYEGYIRNSHDIKFWVESRGGGLTDFETFCDTPNAIGSARNPGTGLHVDAAVVKVRFQYSTPYPLGTDLQAVLETENQSLVCEHFYLTPHMREGDNLCQKLLTEKYDGIVLGVRQGTLYLGGDDSSEGYRTMDGDAENTPVVLVV
ncbi:hypothetical protein L207DRAFT_610839 [Hyaloscypha variabilis F]|uniref:Heterokaryon incompatibility domain-containing protein n=1 Tax=Hyaloscypha variabilis (strain UAMH 11265 / GT02V1 / F) TaxID=1149755 RepID=A0A2J6QYZ4_HYAVF|nr:hypothetical protein L207DRAFT_610839 [Hyaloscypha variabilis F]